MKITTHEEVAVARDAVWTDLADFRGFERRAARHGITLERTDDGTAGPAGAAWHTMLTIGGVTRPLRARVARFEPPDLLEIAGDSEGLSFHFTLALAALAENRTRVDAAVEIRPATLTARLLMQPLKLARGTIESRFAAGIADAAQRIEARHRAGDSHASGGKPDVIGGA